MLEDDILKLHTQILEKGRREGRKIATFYQVEKITSSFKESPVGWQRQILRDLNISDSPEFCGKRLYR